MKTRKTNEETTSPSAKGKLKIKNLKLTKETLETLSDQDARAVKGGATGVCQTQWCQTS